MDSSFARLIGALAAPVKTFRSIAERPTWLVAFLVVMLSPLLPCILAVPKIDGEEVAKTNLEKMDIQVPQEQFDKQVEAMAKFGPVMTYSAPAFMAIGLLLYALTFWGAFTLAGGEAGFKRALAVVSHAMLPMVVGALLSVPVIVRTQTINSEQLQTGSYLKSNLAAFAPADANVALLALLSKIDVFSIWSLVLLAIGFRFAAKVSPRTATITVLLLWLVWVGVTVGFASLGMIFGGGRHG